MKLQRAALLFALAGLASCGRVADLKPAAGHALPVKPLMTRTTPTANELLTLPPWAKPDRVDELVKRSQARQADPFDLPPPTGGAAPPEPAGAQPATNNTSTSITPGE